MAYAGQRYTVPSTIRQYCSIVRANNTVCSISIVDKRGNSLKFSLEKVRAVSNSGSESHFVNERLKSVLPLYPRPCDAHCWLYPSMDRPRLQRDECGANLTYGSGNFVMSGIGEQALSYYQLMSAVLWAAPGCWLSGFNVNNRVMSGRFTRQIDKVTLVRDNPIYNRNDNFSGISCKNKQLYDGTPVIFDTGSFTYTDAPPPQLALDSLSRFIQILKPHFRAKSIRKRYKGCGNLILYEKKRLRERR